MPKWVKNYARTSGTSFLGTRNAWVRTAGRGIHGAIYGAAFYQLEALALSAIQMASEKERYVFWGIDAENVMEKYLEEQDENEE